MSGRSQRCWRKEPGKWPDVKVVLQDLEGVADEGELTHEVCFCLPWQLIGLRSE
jgi:hypothetical protein